MTGEMAVMTAADGDLRIIWDSDKPVEVEHARKTFDDFRTKGYAAYSVSKSGDRGEVIRKFDPSSERLILAPAMIGG